MSVPTPSYKLVDNLNYGSLISITYRNAEVEDDTTGEVSNEEIIRNYIITNVGPAISEAEADRVFITDLTDGTLMMIEKGIDVLVIKET